MKSFVQRKCFSSHVQKISEGSSSILAVSPVNRAYYGFCGRIIALALKHEVQVGVRFDRVLFRQLAGESVTLEDIRYADQFLYMSWKKKLEMDADTLDSLRLTFVTEAETVGSSERKMMELCHGGKDIVLNISNREEYINLLSQHHFVKSISEQLEHFAQGFQDVLPDYIDQKLFFKSLDLEDFDWLLGGAGSVVSLADWKANTEYKNYEETKKRIASSVGFGRLLRACQQINKGTSYFPGHL